MRLYLASFLQPENFGPGTIYAICIGEKKPRNVKVDKKFGHFIPKTEILNKYFEERETNEKAGENFTNAYQEQLVDVFRDLNQVAAEEHKDPKDILPFKDGDTLCSWERSQYTHYRKILAPFLVELGYELSSN